MYTTCLPPMKSLMILKSQQYTVLNMLKSTVMCGECQERLKTAGDALLRTKTNINHVTEIFWKIKWKRKYQKRSKCRELAIVSAATLKAFFSFVTWLRCQFHLRQNTSAYILKKSMQCQVHADTKVFLMQKKKMKQNGYCLELEEPISEVPWK